jgi:hypothetical protein
MSHYTQKMTELKNRTYLEGAMQVLKIPYTVEKESFIIDQPNHSKIHFELKNGHYELASDQMFWQQSLSPTSFVNQITTEYTECAIRSQLQTQQFEYVGKISRPEGSNRLIFQRWEE